MGGGNCGVCGPVPGGASLTGVVGPWPAVISGNPDKPPTVGSSDVEEIAA